jgi:hypothetical protein
MGMGKMLISPHKNSNEFIPPLTINQKIILFEDRIIWWQLAIANRIINGKPDSNGMADEDMIPDSGFAVLSILLSYFELISKFITGYIGTGQSALFFKKGVHQVFPQINSFPSEVLDGLLSTLYKDVRCGLFHSGKTNSKIVLSGELDAALAYEAKSQMLIINPHKLAPALLHHLQAYISKLRDPANTELREYFERRFDFQED